MTDSTGIGEIDTIEIFEEILDSKMALAMLALGAIVGGIAFMLWQESKRSGGSILSLPKSVPDIDYVDSDDNDDDSEA